ncbi:MAG TPA: hypothetical protein VK638_32650 [Edaphobacter sp.]|nr:hypothetical protein [Edaphobacter sp.]
MQFTRMPFIAQSIALLAANVIGAILYVVAASRGGWAIPEERAAGIYTTTGEPFVWFVSILPIVAIFFVINLAWGAGILTRRNWHGGRLWLLTAAVWLGAVVIDFSHH